MFIVIDGTDGVGKSTQVKMLANYLRDEYKQIVIELSEPTSESDAGKAIREAIKEGRRFEPIVEAAFFVEDRCYDINNRIKPSLEAGKTVVLDRYYYSTVAYQSALGIPKEELYEMHEHFIVEPDLVFILHCPVDIALERVNNRGEQDVMEHREYQERVRKVFREFHSDHIFHVDAVKSADEVHAEIIEHLKDFMELHNLRRKSKTN